ncbi:hypothetical protein HMPREF0063_12062 [Aeromicrobium marinum DSM 15272]|uniref:Uncharacterized protein n=1 Tax=Aeromicrobium marinum DSM 15272 TaxID=585531 RepID=E2SEC6_9ACTN|nr:hypothetical protein HMPREF0063_12062 [Aeromicrobium marinum DSM 15272]
MWGSDRHRCEGTEALLTDRIRRPRVRTVLHEGQRDSKAEDPQYDHSSSGTLGIPSASLN